MRRLLSVLLLVLTAACAGYSHQGTGLEIGDKVPPITLTEFQGKSVTIPEDVEGKVALVRFWSMDCPLCKNEMLLSLDALHHKYREKGYVSMTILEGRPIETDSRLSTFYRVSFPMLIDEYGTAAKDFGVVILPTTFILDEKGILRDRITGDPGIASLERLLTAVLYKEGFYDSNY
jgi:peroxiredoxin